MEAGTKKLENGSKARQRTDTEDRNISFSSALRQYGVPATDIDFVVTDGRDDLRVVIEVTRPDNKVYSAKNYLASIDARRRDESHGNHNDRIISQIAEAMGIPALLVVFEPNVGDAEATVWVRDINGLEWESFTAAKFFKKLRQYAMDGGAYPLGTGTPMNKPPKVFEPEDWELQEGNAPLPAIA
jgi:hypothetical protein